MHVLMHVGYNLLGFIYKYLLGLCLYLPSKLPTPLLFSRVPINLLIHLA